MENDSYKPQALHPLNLFSIIFILAFLFEHYATRAATKVSGLNVYAYLFILFSLCLCE